LLKNPLVDLYEFTYFFIKQLNDQIHALKCGDVGKDERYKKTSYA